MPEAIAQAEVRVAATRRLARWLPLAVVALAGVLVAAITYRLAADADAVHVRGVAELRAEWRARDFERKLAELAAPAAAVRMLLKSGGAVDQEGFDRFVAASHEPGDPLQRIAWATRIVRPDGTDGYRVEFDHSFSNIRSLTGEDLTTDPAHRSTLERARDEAQPLSTPPKPLSTDRAEMVSVLFWPIYAYGDGVVPTDVSERRSLLRGFIAGRWLVAEALNAAIRNTPEIVETIYLFCDAAPSGAPIATYSPQTGRVTSRGSMGPAPPTGALRVTRKFAVFGQDWTVVSDFAPSFLRPLRSAGVWAYPATVLSLTVILMVYLARQQGYRRTVESHVAARTAELQQTNEALAAEIAAGKRTYEQLVHVQKMEAVGNLTGGMAHDFNNLLGVVIGNLDLLRDRTGGDPEAEELAQEALDAALRGADLPRRLLAFARRQPLRPVQADANALVSGMTNLMKRTLGEQIEITLDLARGLWPVVIDPAQLEASLANLANNARDAMPGGGDLIIATANRQLDEDYASQHAEVRPGDYVLIEVTDTGTGMSPEVAGHIFEPFFTTKEQGRGTGLGLSMVFGFMKQSGGHLSVYSEVGIGTTFRLYLPRADTGAEEADGMAAAAPIVRGDGESVLVVEDSAALRRIVVRQLTELGYRVIEAQDAAAALKLLERRRVDLLLTDVVMPGGVSGYDLTRKVRSIWPEVKIILTSGFADAGINGYNRPPDVPLLTKPYRRDDLARAIRRALAEGTAQSAC